jgi:hypothetical protein
MENDIERTCPITLTPTAMHVQSLMILFYPKIKFFFSCGQPWVANMQFI